jgi:hypothetical protein
MEEGLYSYFSWSMVWRNLLFTSRAGVTYTEDGNV